MLFNLGVISALTLLDDADPVLRRPLGRFVPLCLGISGHFFCVIELSSEGQIPVILPKYRKHTSYLIHQLLIAFFFFGNMLVYTIWSKLLL